LAIFGESGFLTTSAIASLTGVDAVTINIAELAGSIISYKLAVMTLILVNAINLISKSVFSFLQGSREFAMKFSFGVAIMILSSMIGLLFV
jgi:uncharacterized membrane protein (DUF4010 family)